MFRLTMLPAEDGDCLLLDYGTEGKQHHILIDGGRTSAYVAARPYLDAIKARGECLDLLVLTHIDADHIEGLLPLINDRSLPVEVKQVWYNGFDKLSMLELYGPAQGDAFSDALKARGWPWNTDFQGGPVVLPNGVPIAVAGPGGLKITLLTPTPKSLQSLRRDWLAYRQSNGMPVEPVEAPPGVEILGAKREPTPENVPELATVVTPEDTTVPNGSSIAFLAEYEGRRVLLAADAHPKDLIAALKALGARTAFDLHLAKIPHHGSKANINASLIREMRTKRYAISTNGARNKHPNAEAIARILYFGERGSELHFNYRTNFTSVWDTEGMRNAYSHRCFFGDENIPGSCRLIYRSVSAQN